MPEAEVILTSGIQFQSVTARDLFAEAEESLRAGEYAKARDLLRDVAIEALSPEVKKKVETLAVYTYIKELIPLRRVGKWKEFVPLAAGAARSFPRSKRLARLVEIGGRESVSPEVRKAFERARELEKSEKWLEAASAYEELLPELNEYYRRLAEEGRARSREAAFRRSYEAAKREEKQGHWVEAIDAVERAEKIRPGNRFLARLVERVRPRAAAQLIRESERLISAGRWEDARKALARAKEFGVGPTDESTVRKVASALEARGRYEAYLSVAAAAMERRNWAKATKELEAARALFGGEKRLTDMLSQVRAGPDDDAFNYAKESATAAKDDWDRAAAAFEDYLKRFREGRHLEEARSGIAEIRVREDDAVFGLAQKAAAAAGGDWRRSIAAYDGYLKRFPKGRHLAEARQGMAEARKKASAAVVAADEEAFEAARNSAAAAAAEKEWNNALAAYEGYLKGFPEGRHVGDARRATAELRTREDDWVFATARRAAAQAGKDWPRATAAYEVYLRRYPKGRHAEEAKRALAVIRDSIEDEFFSSIKKKVSEAEAEGSQARIIAAYEVYLEKHPDGRHAAEMKGALAKVRRRIEDEFFRSVKEKASEAQAQDNWGRVAAAHQLYLKKYPDGRHADEAKLAIAEARERIGAAVVDVAAIEEELARAERPAEPEQKEIAVELGSGVTLEMVWMPPGRFLMGGAGGEENERLVHEVTLTKGFFMGKTEVTNAQWAAVMGSARRVAKAYAGGQQPVVNVAWRDAVSFTTKLSERTGAAFRLPTEAEWEYAARAGSRTPYFFGDDPAAMDEYAWYSKNAGRKTHPVAQKRPNPWGLYDMYGNVWEWCADLYGGDYYAGGQMRDPKGPGEGTERVRRGGAFANHARHIRSSCRGAKRPETRNLAMGFRVVREQ